MVLNLFRRQATPTPARKSLSEQMQAALGDVNKLPTLPDTATRAMSLANDPNSSLTDFARLIERDPPLAAAILKLANSPLYQVGKTVQGVDQAVVRLGLRNCQSLIVAVGMRSLFHNVPAARKQLCEELWDHSFVTASLCRNTNRVLKLGFQGEELAAGLLHDLGRILIAVACPDSVEISDVIELVEGPDVLAQERDLMGCDHCYLGGWFGTQNKLPGGVVSAMRFHHSPENAVSYGPLTALVAMSEHIANYLLAQGDPEAYDLTENAGCQSLMASWGEEAKNRLARLVPMIIADAAKAKGVSRNLFGGA